MAKARTTSFDGKDVTLDIDDDQQFELFTAIYRYNSMKKSLAEMLRSIAKHAESEADSMDKDYMPNALGVFQSRTTIADAKAAELYNQRQLVETLARIFGVKL